MRLLLAVLIAVPAWSGEADRGLDPLVELLEAYSPPEDEVAVQASPSEGARLARLQAQVRFAAEGLETFPATADSAGRFAALAEKTEAALRPFFREHDSALDALYRTLALADYTWALRFPEPPCSPSERRDALLRAPDGLFADPRTGAVSPWLSRLLGADSSGRSAAAALDEAAAPAPLSRMDYARLRARARTLSEALDSERAVGGARARLYCERAGTYEELAAARRVLGGPILAGRAAPARSSDVGVLLLAERTSAGFRAVGGAVAVGAAKGPRVLTDASVAAAQDLAVFERPARGEALGEPVLVTVERRDAVSGLAILLPSGPRALKAARLAAAPPARGAMTRAVAHMTITGAWTEAEGLVIEAGAGWFHTDAALGADMAGGAVFDESGELAGLLVQRPGSFLPIALSASALEGALSGRPLTPLSESASPRNGGTSILLTAAQPFEAAELEVPGHGAVSAGLPGSLGGVNWEGGGGTGFGRFKPSGGSPRRAMGYSPSPNAMMSQAIAQGIGSLIGALFAPRPPRPATPSPAPRYEPQAVETPRTWMVPVLEPVPKPAPPPKPKPRITGVILEAVPAELTGGEEVRLNATVKVAPDDASSAGLGVSFKLPAGAGSFLEPAQRMTSPGGAASTRARLADPKSTSVELSLSVEVSGGALVDGSARASAKVKVLRRPTAEEIVRDRAVGAWDALAEEGKRILDCPPGTRRVPRRARAATMSDEPPDGSPGQAAPVDPRDARTAADCERARAAAERCVDQDCRDEVYLGRAVSQEECRELWTRPGPAPGQISPKTPKPPVELPAQDFECEPDADSESGSGDGSSYMNAAEPKPVPAPDEPGPEVVTEPGAKPRPEEIAAAEAFRRFGFEATFQKTAADHGIQGVRTADLEVKGVGQVDIYTPKNLQSDTISRGIAIKDGQAPTVLVQGDIPVSTMAESAARVWGKPDAKSIKSIFFLSKGNLYRIDRP